MKRLIIAMLAVVFSGLWTVGSAADDAVVIEAVGASYGSELESPRELFERARADAQRVAIEQAVGVFLKSHTIVSNSQLAEDLIYTKVRGKIDKFEVIRQERDRDNPNLFRVRIRATVKPVYPEKHEGITIKAAISRETFNAGDEVELHFQVSADSYVYVFVIGADNSVTQLLPNRVVRQNYYSAGTKVVFPPIDSGIKLKAELLPEFLKSGAEEKIKIIATRKEEPLLKVGFQEGFRVYDARSTGLVSDLLKRLVQLDPADWGELTLVYKIQPGK